MPLDRSPIEAIDMHVDQNPGVSLRISVSLHSASYLHILERSLTTTLCAFTMSQMQTLKNRKEYTQALMPDGVVVMEGVTKNCPICKGMRPAVDNLIKKYPDARFYKYDVDEAEDIAQELGARNVPNFRCVETG